MVLSTCSVAPTTAVGRYRTIRATWTPSPMSLPESLMCRLPVPRGGPAYQIRHDCGVISVYDGEAGPGLPDPVEGDAGVVHVGAVGQEPVRLPWTSPWWAR